MLRTDASGSLSWPTATAGDPEASAVTRTGRSNPTLMDSVDQWQTPASHQGERRRQTGQQTREELLLPGQATQWATPGGMAGGQASRGGERIGEPLLGGQATRWATPAARDYKGANGPEHEGHEGQLANQVAFRFGPQAPPASGPESPPTSGRRLWPTATAGADSGSRNTPRSNAHQGVSLADAATTGSSTSRREGNRMRLNPAFVEWLMGFPIGWTGSGVSEMEWCRWKRRMRSWLWPESLPDD